MAWTTEQLAEMRTWRWALKKAIASGVLTVEDENRTITYKSTAQQQAALQSLDADIADAAGEIETAPARRINAALTRLSPMR